MLPIASLRAGHTRIASGGCRCRCRCGVTDSSTANGDQRARCRSRPASGCDRRVCCPGPLRATSTLTATAWPVETAPPARGCAPVPLRSDAAAAAIPPATRGNRPAHIEAARSADSTRPPIRANAPIPAPRYPVAPAAPRPKFAPRAAAISAADLPLCRNVSGGTQAMGRTFPWPGGESSQRHPHRNLRFIGVITYSEYCLLAVFGDLDKGFRLGHTGTAPGWLRGRRRDWLARYADHCGHQDDGSV